ncbi:MAG TPA: hypothetical protein DD643_06995, partial [Synechococcus sp. UBA8638]|nr:hypothetical protein [Synechococcus sp. UBA8638]
NAFQKPVRHNDKGLAAASVVRLWREVNKLTKAYNLNLGLTAMDLTDSWEGETVASLDKLIGQSLSAAREKN